MAAAGGLVVVLADVVASEGWNRLRRPSRAATARRLGWLLAVPVASQALLELFRLGVYGHLVPTSVVYKPGTAELFLVASKFLVQAAPVVVLELLGAVLARGRQRLLLVPFVVYLVGSIGTLDSANPYGRFFLPVRPLLAVLAGLAFARAAGGAAARWRPLLLAVVVAATTLVVLPGNLDEVHDSQSRYMTCRAGARAELARWLCERTPPDATFSGSHAGLLPARAGERTAGDAFLLNDTVLQRTGPLRPDERASLVHARRPDVIVLVSRDAERLDHVYRTDAAVAKHPAMSVYRLAPVDPGAESCRYRLLAYRP